MLFERERRRRLRRCPAGPSRTGDQDSKVHLTDGAEALVDRVVDFFPHEPEACVRNSGPACKSAAHESNRRSRELALNESGLPSAVVNGIHNAFTW